MNNPNITVYWIKGWLNASTALGHKLMPSAQRWADHLCCVGTLPIIALPGHALIMPSEMVAIWGNFVYMTIYVLEIKLV